MKQFKLILLSALCSLCLLSCGDKLGGAAKDNKYYIYISGEPGKVLNISYLTRPPGVELPDNNITVSESVTLPFFKMVHTIGWPKDLPDNPFLEITTQNDSTTKAIIFDYHLLLADGECGVEVVFNPQPAVDAKHKCAYCADIARDSTLTYLKSIDYPCYMEFSKEETVKSVNLHAWWYKNRE